MANVTGTHVFYLSDGITAIDLRKVISWSPSNLNPTLFLDVRVIDVDCMLKADRLAFEIAKQASVDASNG